MLNCTKRSRGWKYISLSLEILLECQISKSFLLSQVTEQKRRENSANIKKISSRLYLEYWKKNHVQKQNAKKIVRDEWDGKSERKEKKKSTIKIDETNLYL